MTAKDFVRKVGEWDKKTLLRFNGIGGKLFTYFLKFVSFFGRETLWFFLIAVFLFLWYDPVVFVYIGSTFMSGLILVLPIKELVKRERPYESLKDSTELKLLEREQTSRSFPSWHAYNVASQSLMFGFLLNSVLVMVLALLFAALVAFSRIQLGVHYPTDVMAGYILGACGFLLTIFVFGPLFLSITMYFESIATHTIYYYEINRSLFTEPWYIALCVGVFGGIIFSSMLKIIKGRFNKHKTS